MKVNLQNGPDDYLNWRTLGLVIPALLLVAVIYSLACSLPVGGWDPHRLASAYTLAEGLALYPAIDDPAQPGWFYGPGFPALFLPVTLIKSPTWALVVAGLWNALLLLVPVTLLLRAGGLRGSLVSAGTLFTGFLLMSNQHTEVWLSYLHVDGVAVGLSVTAAAAALHYESTGRKRWLHLATFMAVAAAWTKLTDGIFLVAIPCWWIANGRWRLSWDWVVWASVYGAALTCVIFWYFGTERVLFYSVLSQWMNSLRPGNMAAQLLGQGLSLGRGLLPWGLIWGLGLAIARLGRLQSARRGYGYAYLAWLAAVQIPVALLAASKSGGGLNTYHGAIFAAVAIAMFAVLIVQELIRGSGRLGRWSVVFAIGFGVLPAVVTLCAMNGRWCYRPSSHQDELLKLAREHPGQVFFPWNPLITLMADHRQMPTEDGLNCMESIGLKVPVGILQRSIPPEMLIVYDQYAPGRNTMRYFPGREFIEGYESAASPGRKRVFVPNIPAPEKPGTP